MLKKMQVKFTYLPFSEGIWQMGQVEQFDCRICLDQRRTSVHCYPFDTTLSEPDPCRSRWLITERKMLLIFIFWRKKPAILKDERYLTIDDVEINLDRLLGVDDFRFPCNVNVCSLWSCKVEFENLCMHKTSPLQSFSTLY